MKDLLLVLVVILIVVIIWRGPKTLPMIGNMLGRGVKEARKEAEEIKTDLRKDDSAKDQPPAATAGAAPIAPAAPPPAPPQVAPTPPGPPPVPPGDGGPATPGPG
jgi:Sec-independent protein translocase protein TatA